MKGWMELIFVEQETEKFEREERRGRSAHYEWRLRPNYESKGGSPIIGERLRLVSPVVIDLT